ncbi:MAG: acyl-CoA thioesterase [Acidobacteriota bacterium]
MSPFITQRTIEFADTDTGGVVHFSRFFIFMETAEHAFLRSLGIPVFTRVEGRMVSWPRVEASCEYLRPAHYEDTLAIQVQVLRKGTRSVTYGFCFRRGEETIARGRMTAVCCALAEGGRFTAIRIPESIAGRLPGAAD